MTIPQSFLLALLVSAVLVPVCRAVVLRLGGVVPPDGRPGSRPKAVSGGAALALTVGLCSAAAGVIGAVPVLAGCSAGLFLFGMVSDRFVFKPSTKLVAQSAVGCVFLYYGLRLHWSSSVTLDSVITVFWIVGVTSAFDLLDSLDGLSAGIALIAGAAFVMTVLPVAPSSSLYVQTEYVAILLGAIGGLLIYSIHPATVALGDGGSLLIGINVAAMTIQIAPGRGSDLLSVIGVPLLVLLIPFLDATLVALGRIGSGIGNDVSPSSHRLVAIGLSERSAVLLLWLLALISGLIGVASERSRQGPVGLLALLFTLAMALFALYLARIRVHDNGDGRAPEATITPLGVVSYRRRLVEVMLDIVLVSVAYYGAYRLRFEGPRAFAANFDRFAASLPIVLAVQMVALLAAGAYRGMWRYFSLSDSVTFGLAVSAGVVASDAAILLMGHAHGYSQSVLVIYGMLLLLLTVSSRASFRVVSEFVRRRHQTGRRLVLYGAGDAGALAARAVLNDARSAYRIFGFIDDDPRKRNVRVHGYRVIGGYDHLVGLIVSGEVDVVAATQDGLATDGLARLCASYSVTLCRVGLDFLEVSTPELVAAGGGSEARVLSFAGTPAVPRAAGAAASVLRAVAPAADVGHVPIRVVHVITRLILGGAQENTLYTVIGQHRDPRFDVTLLCGIDEAGEGNLFAQADAAGVRMAVMPSLLREIRPFTDVKAVIDLYRFFKAGRFTVVHTHSSKAGIVGRIAARFAGVPVVVHTIHGLAFHEYQSAWKNRLYVVLERLCAPMSQRLVSVSARISDAAIAQGVGRRDQHVRIFSGIELELFLSARDRFTVEQAKARAGLPPDALVVGKIARLFPLKGHEQFLAAAVRIARDVPNVYFLLVGDGPLRDELREHAQRLGLGRRVLMVGRVPPEAVPDYIQAMDVVVHTSLREGIARVLPQAGAVGKPVVTFDLDGAPEVVRSGVSGYLVPPLDTDAIAVRTIELLRDPPRRDAFGEAGRAFAAEHFSIEGMVDRISALYLELIDTSAA